MSQVTPTGAAGQQQPYRAEVNEKGKLFINGTEHLVHNNEGKLVPQLHKLIASEINNPNSSYKPGQGLKFGEHGEYELTITPIAARPEKAKENKSPSFPPLPPLAGKEEYSTSPRTSS